MPPKPEGEKLRHERGKIERLMGVIWEVEESDKLQTFAEKILRLAEIGESETAIPQQLAA